MKEYSAESGTEIAELSHSTTASPEAFAHIALSHLVASRTNPRTTFNQAKLQELADSIRTSGVHQPILVRPLPGNRVQDTDRHVQYEIVAGERRFRACQIASLASIPAMVRNMLDGEVLEVQIIENLQRDDLSELEEAEGFERLMQHSNLNAEAVGQKISKSRSHVYARLRLLDLCLEAKQALRAGTIDASRALLIARIPDGKLQIKAIKFASETNSGSEAPSVRELQTWLRQNVMLPLDRAPFQITDSRLVIDAGSCKTCLKRTGASPDIFAEVSSADICTDVACYEVKSLAHLAALQVKADKKGQRLITGSEAKAICYEKSSTLNGYSPLSQVREDVDGQRLDNLLGKEFAGAVLIENPWSRELIEAVPTAEAEGVLLAKGLLKAVVAAAAPADKAKDEIAQIKKTLERDIEKAYRQQAFDVLVSAIRNTPSPQALHPLITPQLVRAWLIALTEDFPAKDMANRLQMTLDDQQTESQHEETVRLRLQSSDSTTLFQIFAITLIEEDQYQPYPQDKPYPTPMFDAIAASTNIDLPALHAQVKEEVKTRIAKEIDALREKSKAPKTPLATTPLAQPVLSPDADAKTSKTPAKPAPLRKQKLSARDAQLGIAEAMQGIEAEQVPCSDVPVMGSVDVPETGLQLNSPEPVQGTLAVGVLGIGAQVKILGNVKPLHYAKWIGKTGTVKAKMGDSVWDVAFRGNKGGLASFDASELEVVS